MTTLPQVSSYLSACLSPSPPASREVEEVHSLLAPTHWTPMSPRPRRAVWPTATAAPADNVKMEAVESVDAENFDWEDHNDFGGFDSEDEVEEGQIKKEKKKRGRPKKSETSVNGSATETPKKGRGRPKKVKYEEESEEENASSVSKLKKEKSPKKVKKDDESDEDFSGRSSDDDDEDDDWAVGIKVKNGIPKENKSKKGAMSVWPEEIVCQDCGETVKRGKSKEGGRKYEKHQMLHKVEQFTCSCPDLPALPGPTDFVGPRQVKGLYALRERHMKVVHMDWKGCNDCEKSFETVEKLEAHMTGWSHTKNEDGEPEKKRRKRGPNHLVKYPPNMLCPDCGENIGEASRRNQDGSSLKKNKDYGAYIRRHLMKHQVGTLLQPCLNAHQLCAG